MRLLDGNSASTPIRHCSLPHQSWLAQCRLSPVPKKANAAWNPSPFAPLLLSDTELDQLQATG